MISSWFVHNLFMTCSLLVHKLWSLVHYVFKTWSQSQPFPNLFVTCSWLYYLFMICARLIRDLIETCSQLIGDLSMTYSWPYSWLSQDLFMTFSWLIHYLFTACSLLVYSLLKTCTLIIQAISWLHDFFLDLLRSYSPLVHAIFMNGTWLAQYLAVSICSWNVHNLFITCSWLTHGLLITW